MNEVPWLPFLLQTEDALFRTGADARGEQRAVRRAGERYKDPNFLSPKRILSPRRMRTSTVAALFEHMKNFTSFRLFMVPAISLLIPTLAQAHPGHGGGEGAGHEFSHVGLGLAALLVSVGIGFAAQKLQAHARARFAAQRKPTPADAGNDRVAQESGR